MPQTVHLVIIDPQVDFCSPEGAHYVPGAEADVGRLARMIDRLGGKLAAAQRAPASRSTRTG